MLSGKRYGSVCIVPTYIFSSWIRNPTDVVPVQRRWGAREHYLPVLAFVTHIEMKVRNNSDQGNMPTGYRWRGMDKIEHT